MAEIGDGLLGNWGWIILTQHVASRSHGSRLAAAKSEEGLQFPTGAFISLKMMSLNLLPLARPAETCWGLGSGGLK